MWPFSKPAGLPVLAERAGRVVSVRGVERVRITVTVGEQFDIYFTKKPCVKIGDKVRKGGKLGHG